MDVRRIVTGFDASGHSMVVSDGPAPRTRDFAAIPGFSNTTVWATLDDRAPSGAPADPTLGMASLLPQPGGSTMFVVSFPPETAFADVDPEAADAEQREYLPGLSESFDPARPGFHRTSSVDYVVVLKGELWLELEAGPQTLVKTGDIVIQNGTWHAWRNRSSSPVVIAAISLGVRPDRTP